MRVTGGKAETAATLPEKEVTAIAIGPDGAVYAGASPGGKVYRVANGRADVYYETGAKYVWALAFGGPALYVATGLPGEIHRVTSARQGERVHAASDPHVKSLYFDSEKRLWAGTAGSGIVLRLDPNGKVSTVYDSSKTEISSITASADGRIWAAAVASEGSAGSGEPITAPVALPTGKAPRGPGRDEDENKDKAEVTVSVSSARVAPPPFGEGRVLLRGPPLLARGAAAGRVVELGGARLRSRAGRREGRSARGDGAQRQALPRHEWFVVSRSNARRKAGDRAVRRRDRDQRLVRRVPAVRGARKGEYVSAVKDTGRTSRFGTFRFDGDVPAGADVEFAFRSGESQVPDAAWSGWSAWTSGPQATKVAAPPGRYLQWRVRMSSDGNAAPTVRRTEAAYRNRNTAPDVESLTALAPAEVLARSTSGGSNVFETQSPDERRHLHGTRGGEGRRGAAAAPPEGISHAHLEGRRP